MLRGMSMRRKCRLQSQREGVQTELEGMKKLKDDAEEKLQMVASQEVHFTYGAYQKGLSHVRSLYPEAVLGRMSFSSSMRFLMGGSSNTAPTRPTSMS